MDWKQQLPRYGDARRELLQATVDEVAKYEAATEAAAAMGISIETLRSRLRSAAKDCIIPKYLTKKPEKQDIPQGILSSSQVIDITGVHKVLIISDIHIPYHDHKALTLALDHGKDCDVIILNGDIMDCAAVSDHEKTPDQRMGFEREIEVTKSVLSAIRKRFPNALIYYNEGNHEYRLPRYLSKRAPELYGMMDIPSLLNLDMYGIKWVPRSVAVRLGRLHLIHGDEYRGGGGINIARSKFLAAGDNVIFGHHHRTQEYIHRTIGDKVIGSWAVGCLCDLKPDWLVRNQWNHGFAIVHTKESGNFVIENRKVLDGSIY